MSGRSAPVLVEVEQSCWCEPARPARCPCDRGVVPCLAGSGCPREGAHRQRLGAEQVEQRVAVDLLGKAGLSSRLKVRTPCRQAALVVPADEGAALTAGRGHVLLQPAAVDLLLGADGQAVDADLPVIVQPVG